MTQSSANSSVTALTQATVAPAPSAGFDIAVDTLIIGAGACGLIAALAAAESGQNVLVVEADAIPSGSTALSAGLIPAAGTRLQHELGIDDCASQFANDIQAKANNENEPTLVAALAEGASEVIHWLMDRHGLAFSLVNDFDYPGHSQRRMHGLPSRSGRELVDALRVACERLGIDIICNRRALLLHNEGLSIRGVTVLDPQGDRESIACRKLILACNGFGGNKAMVSRFMPSIENAVWFGHDGNRGEAVLWAQELGARVRHLGAFQGHGNVAHPHGILITWAVITQGGIQLNKRGLRFWNEAQGYSEAARAVLSQPGGVATTVFDERIAAIARQFEDFKQAESENAVVPFDTLEALATHFALPADSVRRSVLKLPLEGIDEFGRRFDNPPLTAPYYGVRVTGALFHTQGGLEVDGHARVLHTSGAMFTNLYAGGGAACGVSGKGDSGYLSGNGLLAAVVLGYRAGQAPLRAGN